LLGLIEIFSNLPASRQSVQQLLSYPVIWFGHRFCLPTREKTTTRTEFMLPFRGQWYVANGGVDKETSHSWHVWPQRYACDFVMVDESGKTHSGSGRELRDYYCYGQDVLAPADGEVVSMAGNHPESRAYGDDRLNAGRRIFAGTTLRSGTVKGSFSTVAHLMPGSVTVALGQKVVRGQVIAKCGNSGNTSESHIHFQLNMENAFSLPQGCLSNLKMYAQRKTGKHALRNISQKASLWKTAARFRFPE
jgi:murein DD-endopeptidase MepM/ murein hydrolase activator NlpD